MSSETEISNIAISHLGISKEIANLDTEASTEAKACRRFYDICRDTVLRDFNWPFATKSVALGLVGEDPTTEWQYSYRYPSDCIKLRRIFSGTRTDTNSSGRLIYTDEQNAVIEYTEKVTDPTHYPPDFILAQSYRLAFMIAPRVSKGDPFKLGPAAYQMYLKMVGEAQANSWNEEQIDKKADSEFITTRNE
jgi:hypothetical protein